MIYNIAGISLSFTGNNQYFFDRCAPFLDSSGKEPEECDMQVYFDTVDEIVIPDGDEIIDDTVVVRRKKGPDPGYYIFIRTKGEEKNQQKRTVTITETNREWTKISLKYMKNDQKLLREDGLSPFSWTDYHCFMSVGYAFRNYLIRNRGLAIHSSAIEYEGKGLIFSASSGTGKSTHTRLWKELYGDKVTLLNDDRPAIRIIDQEPMLCGIPWSGSSDLFENRITPLHAIVMLERSMENSIEKLPVVSALQRLMPRCFFSYYDQDMMNEGMDTLEKIIEKVPVYLLKCRPDFEAVELVKKCTI